MENLIIPSDLIEPLFELQAEDLLLGQLEHKIKNLPEREKLLLLKDEEDKLEKSISITLMRKKIAVNSVRPT